MPSNPKHRPGKRMPESAERLYDRDAYGQSHLIGLRAGQWYQFGYKATYYKAEQSFSFTPKTWRIMEEKAAMIEVVDHLHKPHLQRAYRITMERAKEVMYGVEIMGGGQMRCRLPIAAFDAYDIDGLLVEEATYATG